jgi:hypothetical protein
MFLFKSTDYFVSTGNIDDVNGEVGELATEVGGQVVAPRFHKDDLAQHDDKRSFFTSHFA